MWNNYTDQHTAKEVYNVRDQAIEQALTASRLSGVGVNMRKALSEPHSPLCMWWQNVMTQIYSVAHKHTLTTNGKKI